MRMPQRFLPGLVFVAAIVAGCGWEFFGVRTSPILARS
jgi:hypothetical protein